VIADGVAAGRTKVTAAEMSAPVAEESVAEEPAEEEAVSESEPQPEPELEPAAVVEGGESE
jgi:hypothetical protein